ncbi:LytR/AlgR family response regulator transcription factor [Fluviicola taffensis]|uniref:Two component transcriptional regulator, LytTR family n=1 Tax=Fluviicola taffensis (strain DSM 16823 / NCIMB 13979 / RW262) TaxID=755732 RepID=F2IFC3_FLUTR|nr:response regulator transcription factor [Fluviicola taffensis]AEA44608.1 two component transcriptional regulator, LytTR family [Fluviicola taffensis DSM 16823]
MTRKIRCLVVDDEKLAQEVLIHHISKFEILKLEGVCNNVFELISFLNRDKNIDVIFLDIKMPEINGTDFVNMFNHPPAIIYTTAYNKYALDAFDQSALDYLLKPISLERFSKAVQKAQHVLTIQEQSIPAGNENRNNPFYVKSNKKLVKIDPEQILYIEGMRNYICLYLETEKVIVHGTLTGIEENLNHIDHIIRVHKSFFINLHKVKYLEQHIITLSNTKNIPIGLYYREQVYEKLKVI